MAERRRLCRLEELDDPGSRGFELETGEGVIALFLVRRGGVVRAYRNSCPHTGAPLEWQPDQFLDFRGEYVQCALHGALFDMDSGLCLRGPCVGDSLGPLPVEVESGWVWVVLEGG